MPEPMSVEQIKAAMDGHGPDAGECRTCDWADWPCEPYRLAEAVLSERKRANEAETRLQRVRDLADGWTIRFTGDRASTAPVAASTLAAIDIYAALNIDRPAPEQPTHHTNDCDLLIRNRACSCGYAPDPFGRSADQ